MMEGMRLIKCVLLLAAVCSACVSTTPPSAPSSQIDVTGTWRGLFTVAGLAAPMTWTLTQSGNNVTGTMFVSQPNGIVLLNGNVTGTMTGSTLDYAIAVGQGGIPSQPTCTGQIRGSATVTTGNTSTLRGTYSLASATCTPPFGSSGDINLTR
jgi:ABC-type Fe3+-hydroxamate transport system substrate-binding protein